MTGKLFKCIPEAYLHIPKQRRLLTGKIIITLFGLSFLSPAYGALILFAPFTGFHPLFFALFVPILISYLIPYREWPNIRKLFQLLYEPLDFHTNIDEKRQKEAVDGHNNGIQYILAMHPHGIIPFPALLWAAFCDQYLQDKSISDRTSPLYGFGAAADMVKYVPFLRNILGWLSTETASYHVLKKGLLEGKVSTVKTRTPRHLFILPGGIAEIYTSRPTEHKVVFLHRKGLCKLALETGAHLVPIYVFGATDFYYNLISGDNIISKLSRYFRSGFTYYWGHYYLPLPFFPKITMIAAEPIEVKKWRGDGPPPEELINKVHSQYISALINVFDEYKADAGCPNATLEII